MNFSEYLLNYMKKRGIKKILISKILNISYATLRTKFERNTFTYSEVLYLDHYFKDLIFIENYHRYLDLIEFYKSGSEV